MGSAFRKSYTKPVPAAAEIVEKAGVKFARVRVRGRARTVRLTTADDGTTPRLLVESTVYYARYRDHTGKPVERSTGCREEANARRRLTEWEREVERVRAGVLTAADVDVSQHSRTPLEDHFAAFDTRQRARGTADKYRENTLRALRRVATDCGFRVLSDLRAEPVERWLVGRAGANSSARTRNLHRESLLVFCNWCVETGRLAANPFIGLSRANVKADPKRQRRALTEEELNRLLAVARTRPLQGKLAINRGDRKGEAGANLSETTRAALERSGRERALVYKTLVLTGLRKGELGSLTVARVRLDDPAHVVLAAADEKARRGALVPLRADLAGELREWLATRLDEARAAARQEGGPIPETLPADAPLFHIPLHLNRNMKKDLAAAGIPVRDDRGFVVDVHALRHTFGTLLAKGGVSPRVAQELLRHSDPRLTANVYTHLKITDTGSALAVLPALATPPAPGSLAPQLALPACKRRQNGTIPDTQGQLSDSTSGTEEIDVKPYPVNENGPLTTTVISGPGEPRDFKKVAAVGFEPSFPSTSAGLRSHHRRVEFSSAASPYVTKLAPVVRVTHWCETGNTAHPLPTLCPPRSEGMWYFSR